MKVAYETARAYGARGGDPAALFGVYVGLIAEQDAEMASTTLKALDMTMPEKGKLPPHGKHRQP